MLNLLLRFDGYEPRRAAPAVLHRAADATLAVHNVTRLQQLAGAIASLDETINPGRQTMEMQGARHGDRQQQAWGGLERPPRCF